ncbi:UDP-glucuronosyltransferase 1-6 [Biomphalaria glabrata]|uniref:UDP-glucuronosyltransferase n=1 Tax=Biomphalaria glabrata TaxID=6526 RepID=A0A9U8E6E9_BIOGL|nr:UDP-glucuronosyltransferase 1-6-like [Biomphalaria glabrata]KAI8736772.1 UDP-glucuronosyltransferase 1-6-like [Biomphalaria glabrata]
MWKYWQRIMASLALFNALLLCLLLQNLLADAKVVVLLSAPHTADVRTYTNVARELSSYGHETYVCVPQFLLDSNLVNTDGVKVIPYGQYLNNFDSFFFQTVLDRFWRGENIWVRDYVSLIQSMQAIVRQILTDQNLITTLRTIKPDLFILTNGPFFRNIVTLPYMLNISFAYLGSFNDLPGQRVPFSPSSTACPGYPEFKEEGMGFYGRLATSLCNVVVTFLDHYFMDDKMVAELAPNSPKASVSEISRMAKVYIIESEPILDYAKPEMPYMKLIGSTALTKPADLMPPLKSFIDNSEKGVALVSSANIPAPIAKKMMLAFQQQNLSVIWRVHFSPANTSRLMTMPWVPQNDILANRKTRLFVSHCGTHSQYDALYHGVPILCLPLYGDQFYNAERAKSKGFGLSANLATISYKQLAKLMSKVADTDKYRNSIERASSLYKMFYKNPSETAAFWIDHVIENGGIYMRSTAQTLPLFKLLTLDIMAFVFLVIAAVILVIVCACVFCFKIARKCLTALVRPKLKKS